MWDTNNHFFSQSPGVMQPGFPESYNAAYIDLAKEQALVQAKTDAAIHKMQMKKELEVEAEREKMQLREDVKIAAGCIEDAFTIGESGEVERRQEFLLAAPRIFKSANFQVLNVKNLQLFSDDVTSVLKVQLRLEKGEDRIVFLDLREERGRYFSRKFREVGARLRLKRGDTNEVYLHLVDALRAVAERVIIPERNGFFRVGGNWYYAGKSSLIWKDVERYAK